MEVLYFQQHSLNTEQLQQLETLLIECSRHDDYLPEVYWHLLKIPSNFKSSFLAFCNGQLIGFLRVFFFYQHHAEIILFVHPKHRRQGIAKKLFQEVRPLLKNEQIEGLYFSQKENHSCWLTKLNATFHHTDFSLEHSLTKLQPLSLVDKISTASQQDYQALIQLDALCFENPTLNEARLHQLIKDPTYKVWCIHQNNHPIAKLHLQLDGHNSEIFDVAVHPDYRKQGYATALINYALKFSANHKVPAVNLSVEAKNKNAALLYFKLGFSLKKAKHYWYIPNILGFENSWL